MRYPLYNQIKEILKTVIEALEYVQRNRDVEMAAQLLSDGNAAIEQISEKIIENKTSVKHPDIFNLFTVLLERFPNALHKLEYLSDFEDVEFLINATKELLDEVDENVEYKFSVVFFAELGQKWDAMNSLYEAFKEREDCRVEVVLTPIFRQVRDGDSVKQEVIYEDYLTDLGIDFTPYERYDISLDPPDMAFISNPYESVTVPQFWPENIAEHTRLVYVPYYTKNSLNDNLMKTESTLPFIHKAWRILVQSEETKEAYKKYSGSEKENFIVTDLPKWDELFSVIRKENLKVSEWDKLDGKAVFLWNIHYSINSPVSTLLDNGKEIIRIFDKNKDIGLIFRPHPMTETIFKLYQPDYLDYWQEIKEAIKASSNMVLDTNSSYKNAFAYSDALLSEHSSILSEYAFLKKPVLWLKKEETDKYFENAEFIDHVKKLKQSHTIEQVEQFISNVHENPEEMEYMNRITQDLSIVDGKNGERVADLLIKEYLLSL